MILENILNAIYNLFSFLTSSIDIPDLPSNVESYIFSSFDLIQNGIYILNNIFDMQYILTLTLVLLGIDVGIRVYHFIMWVIKKIPMLNIS